MVKTVVASNDRKRKSKCAKLATVAEFVKFDIEKSKEGWLTIEFLAWAINHEYDEDLTVFFVPNSNPPVDKCTFRDFKLGYRRI